MTRITKVIVVRKQECKINTTKKIIRVMGIAVGSSFAGKDGAIVKTKIIIGKI